MADLTLFEVISAKRILKEAKLRGNIRNHVQEFEIIIEGMRGSDIMKIYSLTSVEPFFKYFPMLYAPLLLAFKDALRSPDIDIRIRGMLILTSLCAHDVDLTKAAAFLLTDMLTAEDNNEYTIATHSLQELIKLRSYSALQGFLLKLDRNKPIAEYCIPFMVGVWFISCDRMKILSERLLISGMQRIIKQTSVTNSMFLMEYIMASSFGHTSEGRAYLIDLVTYFACKDTQGVIGEVQSSPRLNFCIDYYFVYASTGEKPQILVKSIVDKILPFYKTIYFATNGIQKQKEFLKKLAELTFACGRFVVPASLLKKVFDVMKLHLPNPYDCVEMHVPDLDYTSMECLLFIFYKLLKLCPNFKQSLRNMFHAQDFLDYMNFLKECVTKSVRIIKQSNEYEAWDKKSLYLASTSNVLKLIYSLKELPRIRRCYIELSWTILSLEEEDEGILSDTSSTSDSDSSDQGEENPRRSPATRKRSASPANPLGLEGANKRCNNSNA